MVTDNHIRLTANRQSQQGAIWNKVVSKKTPNMTKIYESGDDHQVVRMI